MQTEVSVVNANQIEKYHILKSLTWYGKHQNIGRDSYSHSGDHSEQYIYPNWGLKSSRFFCHLNWLSCKVLVVRFFLKLNHVDFQRGGFFGCVVWPSPEMFTKCLHQISNITLMMKDDFSWCMKVKDRIQAPILQVLTLDVLKLFVFDLYTTCTSEIVRSTSKGKLMESIQQERIWHFKLISAINIK